MSDEIQKVAKNFEKQVSKWTELESQQHYDAQRKSYDNEYSHFISAYKNDTCYLCGKKFSTISKKTPCIHWLLRRCKFKKKDILLITEKYDFYNISAFLRWVSNAETRSKNINNLKEESSNRKLFEITIKWKNIEWTLDCSHNDFKGHKGTKTDFPHWHIQMRIDNNQFINFNDFHLPFSKDDRLKLTLEENPDSSFHHTFGPEGQGMQEKMEQFSKNPDEFLENAISSQDPEDGSIHIQTMVSAPDGGISGEQLDKAMDMHKKTGKLLAYCFQKVLENDKNVSFTSIASPSESVPKIAKRTERKRR